MKKIYTNRAIYYYTLEKQRNQIKTWFDENIVLCSLNEGALLDILYSDFSDKNNINLDKFTKRSFALFLNLLLKEKKIHYKIVNKRVGQTSKTKRKYLGLILPVLK